MLSASQSITLPLNPHLCDLSLQQHVTPWNITVLVAGAPVFLLLLWLSLQGSFAITPPGPFIKYPQGSSPAPHSHLSLSNLHLLPRAITWDLDRSLLQCLEPALYTPSHKVVPLPELRARMNGILFTLTTNPPPTPAAPVGTKPCWPHSSVMSLIVYFGLPRPLPPCRASPLSLQQLATGLVFLSESCLLQFILHPELEELSEISNLLVTPLL